MGISVVNEIPLIRGYVVEIPTSILSKLARYRNLRYIAADIDIKPVSSSISSKGSRVKECEDANFRTSIQDVV
jgi:hypothetical protein